MSRLGSLLILPLWVVTTWAQSPTVRSVVNGASFSSGVAVAPGSIIAIFGDALASAEANASAPLPTSINGISVTIGGRRAPLFYVGPHQINAQLPYETPTGSASLVVSGAAGSSAPFGFRVADIGPGVFLWSTNRAVAQNQDWGLNTASHPAKAGESIVVYLTGIGQLDNAVATGSPAPSSPLSKPPGGVRVTIGGQAAAVQFLGLTPGFVGLAQLNVMIPAIPSGDYPVTITVYGPYGGSGVSNSAMVSVVSAISEFKLSSTQWGIYPVTAVRLKDGRILFTWGEWQTGTNSTPAGCWAQVFRDGSPSGSKFKLDSDNQLDNCVVTSAADGGFIVVFGGNQRQLRVRKFNSQLNSVQSADLALSGNPQVAELSDGTVVVANTTYQLVRFDAGLRPLVNPDYWTMMGNQRGLSLMALPSRGFVRTGGWVWRFDNDGKLVIVNRQTQVSGAAVTCDGRGDLWAAFTLYHSPPYQDGLYMSQYSPDGVRLGSYYPVDSKLADYPDVAVTDNDSIVVTWRDSSRPLARVFRSDGTPLTQSFETSPHDGSALFGPNVFTTLGAGDKLYFTSLRFNANDPYPGLYVTIHSALP